MGSDRAGRGRMRSLIVAVSLAALTACSGEAVDGGEDRAASPGSDVASDAAVAAREGAQAEQPRLELVTDGTLTVCIEASFPPFDYVDDDHPLGYAGFDIELLDAVAASAALSPITVVEVGFEDIVSGAALGEGLCDVGASAIAISPSRAERLAFTVPYYESRSSLYVPASAGIERLDELADDHVVGVQRDTAAADRATEQVGVARIRVFEQVDELFAAFDRGEIDAVLHDLAAARAYADEDDEVVVVDRAASAARYGFAVAADREDHLLELLDAGLETVRSDGTYDALFEDHFGIG